jgi:GDPmannose 4,6-dehydratase
VNPRKALIVGVSSQDGSYLADLLLTKNYEVIGTIRRSTNFYHENIAHLYGKIKIVAADLVDGESLVQVIKEHQPDEIYTISPPNLFLQIAGHILFIQPK